VYRRVCELLRAEQGIDMDERILSASAAAKRSSFRGPLYNGSDTPRHGTGKAMSEVTRILSAIEGGDPQAASQLLRLVYDELRKLGAQKLAQEKPGQTLDPTALVHEAYLRLVAGEKVSGEDQWRNRRHFFAAAAEAMRRILVEGARRKKRVKHGGDRARVDLREPELTAPPPEDILALDEALTRLEQEDPAAARVVQLHFFAGLPLEQAAEALGISRATAYRQWAYARAWLGCAVEGEPPA
jgi:RNA polymerase sigma factor (TIGR02999 family)